MTISVLGRPNRIQYEGSHNQRWGHVSFSQHSEDLMVVNIFEQLGVELPSYLDLGAHHPVEISNTHLLYLRGSRGTNIEANPFLIGAFHKERPDDINVNLGVISRGAPCKLPFYMYHDLHGCNSFSAIEIDKHAKDEGWQIQKTIELRCEAINDIVDQFCPGAVFPDFLSCDLEGFDYDILQAANFLKSAPMVICVETWDATAMTDMLMLKGFSPYCRMYANVIYVRNDKMAILNERLGAV